MTVDPRANSRRHLAPRAPRSALVLDRAHATPPALSDGGWQVRARCLGTSTDTFYPPDQARGRSRRLSERAAKQICETCPVLLQCRRHAVNAAEPHGIWGGTTPEERDELRRGRSVARAALPN